MRRLAFAAQLLAVLTVASPAALAQGAPHLLVFDVTSSPEAPAAAGRVFSLSTALGRSIAAELEGAGPASDRRSAVLRMLERSEEATDISRWAGTRGDTIHIFVFHDSRTSLRVSIMEHSRAADEPREAGQNGARPAPRAPGSGQQPPSSRSRGEDAPQLYRTAYVLTEREAIVEIAAIIVNTTKSNVKDFRATAPREPSNPVLAGAERVAQSIINTTKSNTKDFIVVAPADSSRRTRDPSEEATSYINTTKSNTKDFRIIPRREGTRGPLPPRAVVRLAPAPGAPPAVRATLVTGRH
jgi:hypothetical protein